MRLLDCFASLAMTVTHMSTFSRHTVPEFCKKWFALQMRGAGNAGCTVHPQPVCKGRKHTVVTTVAPDHPAFPHAMV